MATTPNKTKLTSDTTSQADFKAEMNNFVDYTEEIKTNIDDHLMDDTNPHNVTASQVGAVSVSDVSPAALPNKVVQRDPDGNIAGDILGNAATATNAEQLDGHSWSDLAATFDAGHSFSGNGYQKFGNGLIIQWGTGDTNASGTAEVAFPIPFPNVCLKIVASIEGAYSDPGIVETVIINKTKFGLYARSGGSWATRPCAYIAIGY